MGMVMYMDGFHWTLKGENSSCLNFLVASWKLNTVARFVCCMVCVVAMGIATEGINRWKHSVFQTLQKTTTTTTSNGKRQRLVVMHTGLQGLSILSAYLLMLVVMTYSLELLVCVVGGLMIGHYVFDGDALLQRGGGTLCCNFLEQGQSPHTSETQALLTISPSGSDGEDSGLTNDHGASEESDYSCCNNNNDDDGGLNGEEGI